MKWFYDFVKITSAIPLLLWYRPKIVYEGGEKIRVKKRALIIANHIGLTDPIYVMLGIWYRRIRFVCMKEFWEKPVSRAFFKACMCIPIDRENVGIDTFREITDSLREEKAVAIFPGGHVDTVGDDVGAFKSGMILMAIKGSAPILPVVLVRRAHWYQRLRLVVGKPVDIKARYGARPKMSEIDEIASELKNKEKELKALVK